MAFAKFPEIWSLKQFQLEKSFLTKKSPESLIDRVHIVKLSMGSLKSVMSLLIIIVGPGIWYIL